MAEDAKRRKGPGLPMKALAAAAGVAPSTILFYVQQGLLPEPVRTSHNMAYYDPRCVDRVRLIQHLKRHQRLTLAEIRATLGAKGAASDLSVFADLNDLVFSERGAGDPIGRRAFLAATGLAEDQLRSLLDARLLQPLERGRFDAQDVAIGTVYAAALGRGIAVADLGFYVELGAKVVEREMALRRRITHHLPDAEDAALTLEMVRSARLCRRYVIDRLFQHGVAALRGLKDVKP